MQELVGGAGEDADSIQLRHQVGVLVQHKPELGQGSQEPPAMGWGRRPSLPHLPGSPPRILDALRCVTHHHEPPLPGHHNSPLLAARTAAPMGSTTHTHTHTCGTHTGCLAHSLVSHIAAYITLPGDDPAPPPIPLADLSVPVTLCHQLPGHLKPIGGWGSLECALAEGTRHRLHMAWSAARIDQLVPGDKTMSTATPSITPPSSPDHLFRGGPDVAVELTQLLL